jgi:hypothetical protein
LLQTRTTRRTHSNVKLEHTLLSSANLEQHFISNSNTAPITILCRTRTQLHRTCSNTIFLLNSNTIDSLIELTYILSFLISKRRMYSQFVSNSNAILFRIRSLEHVELEQDFSSHSNTSNIILSRTRTRLYFELGHTPNTISI